MLKKVFCGVGMLGLSVMCFAEPTSSVVVGMPLDCAKMLEKIATPSAQNEVRVATQGLSAPLRQLRQVKIDAVIYAKYNRVIEQGSRQISYAYLPDGRLQQCIAAQDQLGATLSHRGLIDLNSYFRVMPDKIFVIKNSDIHLQGNWRDLLVGKSVSFSYLHTMESQEAPDTQPTVTKEPVSATCAIKAQIAAKTLHPQLKGMAKIFECTFKDNKQRPTNTTKFNYLGLETVN